MTDAPIPFVEIDGNPRPQSLEGKWLTLRDGARLRCALALPDGPPRGTVLVLQGRNEAIEKYFETIADLNARGFCVATFDWRGQGGSGRVTGEADKGHIDSIRTHVRDLEEVVEHFVLRACPAPYVAIAHSMGGLVALSAIPKLVDRVDRLVLSAPLVRFTGPAGLVGVLRVASRVMRWTGLARVGLRSVDKAARYSLEKNTLTGDRRRFERNLTLYREASHLFVPRLTAGWFAACFTAMRRLDDSDHIAKLHLPTLIVTAGADRVVDSGAAEKLAWRMRSGHFITIVGARHELLQEADIYREQFLAAFEGFVGSMMPVAVPTPPLPADFEAEIDAAAADTVPAPETVPAGVTH